MLVLLLCYASVYVTRMGRASWSNDHGGVHGSSARGRIISDRNTAWDPDVMILFEMVSQDLVCEMDIVIHR